MPALADCRHFTHEHHIGADVPAPDSRPSLHLMFTWIALRETLPTSRWQSHPLTFFQLKMCRFCQETRRDDEECRGVQQKLSWRLFSLCGSKFITSDLNGPDTESSGAQTCVYSRFLLTDDQLIKEVFHDLTSVKAEAHWPTTAEQRNAQI